MEMKHEAEIMEGNFEGIGIEFFHTKDTIQVVTPISGGPSEQAGISAGDKIIKINDTTVAGIKSPMKWWWRNERPKDKQSESDHAQEWYKKLVTYTIRDKIPLYSVDAGFMLDKGTGYIKINRFSKTTYQEFYDKLDALSKQGMQRLVLDLRQNLAVSWIRPLPLPMNFRWQ